MQFLTNAFNAITRNPIANQIGRGLMSAASQALPYVSPLLNQAVGRGNMLLQGYAQRQLGNLAQRYGSHPLGGLLINQLANRVPGFINAGANFAHQLVTQAPQTLYSSGGGGFGPQQPQLPPQTPMPPTLPDGSYAYGDPGTSMSLTGIYGGGGGGGGGGAVFDPSSGMYTV